MHHPKLRLKGIPNVAKDINDVESLPDGKDTERTAVICYIAGLFCNIWRVAIDEVEHNSEHDHFEADQNSRDRDNHVEVSERVCRMETGTRDGESKLGVVSAISHAKCGKTLPLG